MAISSPGVGSGLDVNSIVSQLVAIEKQRLQPLQTKATTFQSQLSLYGTIKSQVSTLGDAASALASATTWAAQKASSSNTAVATVTASASAASTTFGLDVTQLAQAQTVATRSVTAGTAIGNSGETGTLSIRLGTWTPSNPGGLPPVAESFAPGAAAAVDVAISGTDTLTTIAGKINAANAGVTATVFRSGTQERLTLQSKSTGTAAGFQITATPTSASFSGLDALSLTTLENPAQSATGMETSQQGLDAKVKINGVALESATNTLTDVVPGLTMKLTQLTTPGSPAQVVVEQDQEALQKSVQAFADAYSALNKTIADATKYVQGGKSGVLQGDSTTTGLQRVLRTIASSLSSTGSSFSRLSDVGLEQQADGSMKLNTTKWATAAKDVTNLQKLFTTDNANTSTNGFALKFRDFAKGLIAADGTVSNKSTALQGYIKRNSEDQDRVNERASRVESQLRRQYSALDAIVSKNSALGSYVTAQLAQWNKQS